LASDNVSYDGSDVFQADVTLKNLITQPIGTADGTTVTGIKVFFHTGPVVTSGTGTVTVANADGTGTFTGASQPYFEYSTILQEDEVSAAKTWQWSVPPTVATFEFSVYVSTDIAVVPGGIVFTRHVGNTSTDCKEWGIFAVRPDGSWITQVTDDLSIGRMTPAGSPGGQWVAYTDWFDSPLCQSSPTVKLVRAGGTGAYELTVATSRMPSWSPDGSRIAVWGSQWLSVVDADGSNMVELVQCPFVCEQAEPLLSPQAWSANGDSIYFSLIPDVTGIRPRVIYSVSVADAGISTILDTGQPNRSNTEGVWDAAISIDGWMAFTSDYPSGNEDVYLRDPSGTVYSVIHMSPAADYNPVWSPDGLRLAFVSNRDGSPNIYVLDGGELRQLTAHPNADTDPHWVP
jgi:hypothetical protein